MPDQVPSRSASSLMRDKIVGGATPAQMQDMAALANAIAQMRALRAKFIAFEHLQDSPAAKMVPDGLKPIVRASETLTEGLNRMAGAGMFVPEGREAEFAQAAAFYNTELPMVAIGYMFAKSGKQVTDTERRVFLRMLPGATRSPLTNLNTFDASINTLEDELYSQMRSFATNDQALALQDVINRGDMEAMLMESRGEAGPMLRELERSAQQLGQTQQFATAMEDLSATLVAERNLDVMNPDISTWVMAHKEVRGELERNLIDSRNLPEWQLFTDPETGEQFFGPPPGAMDDPTVMMPDGSPAPEQAQPDVVPQAQPAPQQNVDRGGAEFDLLQMFGPELGVNQ